MFLSRLWMLLVTVFAILASVAFLLAGRPAEYRLTESLEKQLDVAQGLVDLHLRNEARRRLDLLSAMGKDPRIVRPLMAMGSAQRAQDAETKLRKGLEAAVAKSGFGRAVVAVLDTSGRVRARHGAGGGTGDSLAGLPEVKAALRGKCLDTTQLRGKSLYWVYVCPVRYARVGDKVRLVGAIRAELPVDKAFVTELMSIIGQEETRGAKEGKKKLKIALCFFVSDEPVACSESSELWRKYAPGIFQKYKKEILDPAVARSPVVSVGRGEARYLMIVGLLRGAASSGGNYWALLWRFPEATGRFAFLSGKVPRSYLLKGFPWVVVILGSILALALGVFVIIWEADRPLSRLLAEARKVASGEKEKVDETRFKGRFGLLAIAVNEAIERALETGGGSNLHKKNLDAILGELEPETAPPDAYEPPPPNAVADTSRPPPVPPAGSGPAPAAAGSSDAIRPLTVHRATPPAASGFEFQAAEGGLGPEVEAHFKQVYSEFVETKKQCGEDISQLTYEAFRKKLVSNREKIMATRKCRDVRFRVYVKNGKAALKATPVD